MCNDNACVDHPRDYGETENEVADGKLPREFEKCHKKYETCLGCLESYYSVVLHKYQW